MTKLHVTMCDVCRGYFDGHAHHREPVTLLSAGLRLTPSFTSQPNERVDVCLPCRREILSTLSRLAGNKH